MIELKNPESIIANLPNHIEIVVWKNTGYKIIFHSNDKNSDDFALEIFIKCMNEVYWTAVQFYLDGELFLQYPK